MSSKCIIDFVSGTWSPLPLQRITAMAKMGAKLKGIPRFVSLAAKRWGGNFGLNQLGAPIHVNQAPTDTPVHELPWNTFQQDANGKRRAAAYAAGKHFEPASTPDAEWIEYRKELYKAMQTVVTAGSDETRFRVSRELRQLMADSIQDDEFVLDGGDFQSNFSELLGMYGVQWLDALCASELEFFVYQLNAQLSGHQSIEGPHYGRWTVQSRNGGMFGYSHAAVLLCDGQQAGLAAWGSANHGCLISFSGVGCAALDMAELYKVLGKIPGFRLTRVDIALDDFEGEKFDVLTAKDWATAGLFTKRRPPSYCYIESGSLTPVIADGIRRSCGFDPCGGRSFYVGNRKSGLMFRCYEKGKQLDSQEYPNWQRAEVEIRNVDRVIPLDSLIDPDKYFAGAYPCLAQLVAPAEPVAIKTKQGAIDIPEAVTANGVDMSGVSKTGQAFIEKVKATRSAVLHNAAIQAGRVVNYLYHGEQLSPEQIVQLMTSHLELDDVPKRLSIPIPEEFVPDERPVYYGGLVAM